MGDKRKKWVEILRGEFLFNKGGIKGWRMIIFIMSLLLIMVYSSHKVDEKVLRIAKLKKLEKKRKAEFIKTRSQVMKLKLRSQIENRAATIGLYPGEHPAIVIHPEKTEK